VQAREDDAALEALERRGPDLVRDLHHSVVEHATVGAALEVAGDHHPLELRELAVE
jgi:hypothetical protein